MTEYFEPFPGTRGDELGNFASYRKQPHRGSDWSGNDGKIIKAITTGRVKQVFTSEQLGHCLIQSTGDGLHLLYAHMKTKSSRKVGEMVIGGETAIGVVGNTGTATTGSHLHCGLSAAPNPATASYASLVDLHAHIDANSTKPVAAPKPAAKPAAKKAPAKK